MAEATHVGTDVSRWEQFTDWLQRLIKTDATARDLDFVVLGEIAGSATDSRRRQLIGRGIVSVYLALVIVNFIYMLPILAGLPITQTEWNHQLWLPSWR